MISDDMLMAYLDGQVDAGPRGAMERALAADPALRARLAELEANDRAVRSAFDALLDRPVPDCLEAMVRAAAARAGRGPTRRAQGLGERLGAATAALRRTRPAGPGWVGWALAAQAGLLVAAVIVIRPAGPPQDAAYHALGAAPDPRPVNLTVMFRPETPEHVLREALAAADTRIVNGPTVAGAYLLHAPEGERAAAIASLRARHEVLLAEPLDTPQARP